MDPGSLIEVEQSGQEVVEASDEMSKDRNQKDDVDQLELLDVSGNFRVHDRLICVALDAENVDDEARRHACKPDPQIRLGALEVEFCLREVHNSNRAALIEHHGTHVPHKLMSEIQLGDAAQRAGGCILTQVRSFWHNCNE